MGFLFLLHLLKHLDLMFLQQVVQFGCGVNTLPGKNK